MVRLFLTDCFRSVPFSLPESKVNDLRSGARLDSVLDKDTISRLLADLTAKRHGNAATLDNTVISAGNGDFVWAGDPVKPHYRAADKQNFAVRFAL